MDNSWMIYVVSPITNDSHHRQMLQSHSLFGVAANCLLVDALDYQVG